MFIDIRKAYFHAPAQRDVYVQLPDEALEPGEKDQDLRGGCLRHSRPHERAVTDSGPDWLQRSRAPSWR